jgi:hypothetical protein
LGDDTWSCSRARFDWIVRQVAASLDDPEVSGRLTDIADRHFEWLVLAEFSVDEQREILKALDSSLVDSYRANFPTVELHV